MIPRLDSLLTVLLVAGLGMLALRAASAHAHRRVLKRSEDALRARE